RPARKRRRAGPARRRDCSSRWRNLESQAGPAASARQEGRFVRPSRQTPQPAPARKMMRPLVAVLLLAAPLFAAEPPKLSIKSEAVDPPKACAAAVRDLLSDRAIRVSDSSGALCTIWLRKEIPIVASKGEPTYRSITPGTLIGVIRLARSW